MLQLLLAVAIVPDDVSTAAQTRFREPTAVAISADGSRLFVANRRNGSVSVVDLKDGRVAFERDVAKGLSDLKLLADGRLLAVDRERNSLVVLTVGERTIEVGNRFPVAVDPTSLVDAPDGSVCAVASTGSRQLSVVSLNIDPSKNPVRTVELPFAPLKLAWLVPGSKLMVADAFGGKIGVVDVAKVAIESVRSIPGHNLRGLALSPDGRSIVVAHQTLSKLAVSTFEDVHWGSFVANHLRIIPVESLLDPACDLLKGSRLIDLGKTGRAAGDPGAIGFGPSGNLAVALTGVQEIALMADLKTQAIRRVGVGNRPSALVVSPDGSLVYVADSLDDSISVIDVATGSKLKRITLGPRPEAGPVERGERLFFDAKLSHDGWMSCQSCHTDGLDNGLLADTLTDGGFGAPKRVTSLLGVGSTGPWGWRGTTEKLEDQVRKSIETTMRGPKPTTTQVADLTAYLRSLPPPKARAAIDREAVSRGQSVFDTRKCATCHTPPEYSNEGRFDVGLVDEAGNLEFNPPSLRGVELRPPYLHDGRAASLAEVFLKHRHPRQSEWSATEVEDLVSFLRTL